MTRFAPLFPGQGAQFVGMGKPLADSFATTAQIFAQADDILGFKLSKLCFQGPEQELSDTANLQPAIFVTGIAAWEVLHQHLDGGVRPIAAAGHSLGEYAALVAANALEFADALRLVRVRGLAMKTAGEIVRALKISLDFRFYDSANFSEKWR